MKKEFFDVMMQIMRKNKDVFLLFAGLGYPRVDEFIKEFPDRAFNFEASEQTLLDSTVGLAYSDKIPFVYTISPFLYRGFETIRTYIAHERLNVKMVGAGRDDDYSKDDGYSHDAGDIGEYMKILGIECLWPEKNEDVPVIVERMVNDKKPQFLSLRR